MMPEIRDVIHGLIEWGPEEIKIVNTPTFQRLRRISQLAMAELVYPGAHHNRFGHSLGTMHLAGRIAGSLKLSDEEKRLIRLSALLHDIGHGPFSHVSEHLLDKYCDKEKVGGTSRDKIHELVTQDIIMHDPHLSKCIGREMREQITALLGKEGKGCISGIVSGPLDADKLDYLLRDSYYTGAKYGIYDIEKIIESLRQIGSAYDSYLGIDSEGIFALEQLVMAKYHMTTQVYYHRVRLITDSMIVRGIELAIEEGLEPVRKLYSYDGSKEFVQRYLKYYDSNLQSLIIKRGGAVSSKIFKRLRDRSLYKLLFDKQLKEFGSAIVIDRLSNMKPEQVKEYEVKISEALKVDRKEVILKKVDIKNPIGKPVGYSVDDNTILVINKNKPNEPKMLGDFGWSIFNFKGEYTNPILRSMAQQMKWHS